MKRYSLLILILVGWCIIHGCIKNVEVPLRTVEKILVVEGGITNDSSFYRVKLTYSGPFRFGNFVPDSLVETKALVLLKDDAGHETEMVHTSGGVYESVDADFIGIPGRAYHLEIDIPGEKKYRSDPVVMPAPVTSNTISRIEFDFLHYGLRTPSQFKVYANVQDPADGENYYQWKTSGFIPRKATGVSCGFGCIKGEYCQQSMIDTALRFFSDQAINGNMINDQLVATTPTYWFGRYYIDIQQYSISRETYQFLRQFQDQVTKTGSILDPIPSSIVGNIYNVSDSADRALGYFSVSSVYHHRVVLLPLSLSRFILDQSASRFIPVGECILTLPNTTELMDPPGFEDAEEIKFNW
jgi:hypothetical protein